MSVPFSCQAMFDWEPAVKDDTEDVLEVAAHCHRRSPEADGVILPAEIEVEFPPALQLLASTAAEEATL